MDEDQFTAAEPRLAEYGLNVAGERAGVVGVGGENVEDTPGQPYTVMDNGDYS